MESGLNTPQPEQTVSAAGTEWSLDRESVILMGFEGATDAIFASMVQQIDPGNRQGWRVSK
jgi:hypothetical protein